MKKLLIDGGILSLFVFLLQIKSCCILICVRLSRDHTNTPLCFQIATDEDSGVLLYKGDNDHIAMELYRGRLRVSYDTGSYPPSAIYRYLRPEAFLSQWTSGWGLTHHVLSAPRSVETVNDGSFHAVELVASDQTLSLSIDGGTPKTISSIGKESTLNVDSPLYLGGEDSGPIQLD